MKKENRPLGVLRGPLNHYALIKHDADMLAELSQPKDSKQTMYARSAILLHIVSLETLINRIIEDFWPDSGASVSRDEAKSWRTVDKWHKVPLEMTGISFDKGKRPFQYLAELFDIRNDFVHAKANTFTVVYKYHRNEETNQIELTTSEEQPKYGHIGLFKSPSEWVAADAQRVKTITEELVSDLNGT